MLNKFLKKLFLGYAKKLSKTEVFEYTVDLEKIFREKYTDLNIQRMRKQSGELTTNSLLVTFLYILLRDEVPAGKIERIMLQLTNPHDYDNPERVHQEVSLTNGWIGKYAEDIAARLLNEKMTGESLK